MVATQNVRSYVDDVVHRARVPMAPHDHVVRWDEQPRRHKVFPDAQQFALPIGAKLDATLVDSLARRDAAQPAISLDVPALGRVLHDVYGLLSRRLRVTGNDDAVNKTVSAVGTYGRGAANGGGLYPLEFYWVSGPSAAQTPGIYHWNTASGMLQRLATGDVHGSVIEALTGEHPGTDQFLIITVKLWKNAFKYNSFSHHVVTMDLGTVLAAFELAGLTGPAPASTPRLWFDSSPIDDVLGVDSLDETTLAVLPLPGGDREPLPGGSAGRVGARLALVESERFPGVTRFPQVMEVMRDTFEDRHAPRIDDVRPMQSSGTAVALPRPAAPAEPLGLSDLLAARRSSFGTFSAGTPMTQAELAHVLRTADQGARLHTDAGRVGFARLAVFCNHVEGIAPGAYVYQAEGEQLLLLDDASPAGFLQQTYFLDNYNVEQAAAVLAVLVPVDDVLAAGGSRSIRLMNAVVGAATQSAYLAAADLGLACGAALGFDNVAYAERLGLTGSGEWPLIMIMIGRDRHDQADLVASLDLDAKEYV